MTDTPLTARAALVTGAGGAIGRTAVEVLLDLGAERIYACGRRREVLTATSEMAPDRVVPVPLDVGDADGWAGVADIVRTHGRPVAIAVTSAGINRRGSFLDTQPQDWTALWRTNVLGTMLAVRSLLPGMLTEGFGRIVAISSVGARRGIIERAPYAATKGAVESFVRSIAAEVAGSGVTINALAPGVFLTELTSDWLNSRPDIYQQTLAHVPERRFGELGELKAAFRYLFTSPYTQGTTVDVDGGWGIG